MRKYIIRRVAISIPMLFGISIITFVFINLAPGDPINAMIDPITYQGIGDPQALRESMGLNKPILVRYVIWLKEGFKGNFGFSYFSHRPVREIVGERMFATLELTSSALVISTILGTLFGIISALRQYSFYDYGLSIVSLFGISIPTFFFALVALYIFSLKLHLIPSFGMYRADQGFTILSNLHHLAMPAFILSIDSMAGNTRYARTAMLEVLKADYVTTARAKGLAEYVVIGRHAFRNALLPMITISTLRLPGLIGGAVLIEVMFSWPGMGLLSIEAIFKRDYPILMGLTFFSATLVLYANLLADILYAFADPRIRVSG